MSESPEPAARSAAWRDDPLSLFFALCVLVLAMMSVTDWWQQRALDAGQARAQATPLGPLARAECVADSAGYGGDTLVLRCTDASAAQLINALREAGWPWPGDIARVVALDATTSLSCTHATWPDACVSAPRPSRDSLRAHNRQRAGLVSEGSGS